MSNLLSSQPHDSLALQRVDGVGVIDADHVSQSVRFGAKDLDILRDISFQIQAGEQVAITGKSGSGKSTLLGLLAGLDLPSSGRITLSGQNLHLLTEDQRARLRLSDVGFIFQSFHLLSHLSAIDNVMLPLTLARTLTRADAYARAAEMLVQVSLQDRMHHQPSTLSGGEQQRVAIARALVHRPAIVFADEPTGNLDEETAAQIEDVLFRLNREHGTTLVVVTHHQQLAARCGRVLHLHAGQLYEGQRSDHDLEQLL